MARERKLFFGRTDEVRNAVKQKNKAFRKRTRKRNVLNRAEYEEAGSVAEKVKRKAKKEAWENFGEELEEDMEGTRELTHSVATNHKRKEESAMNTIKNNDEELLTDITQVVER